MDSFKPSLGEMSDDQRDEYIPLTSYLHQGDVLYDDSSSESWVSDEMTTQTSEYSDATDTDDDEGQCEMLDSTGTAAVTTIDRLVECVDLFLASEDEESEEDDALQENVVEDRPEETRNVAKRLPRYLRGLMGEANMCFTRGRYEDAVKMCLEIVRLAPTSPLPFQRLAMIYEELRDPNRSLQFGLMVAYLGTQDACEWSRLAQLCLEQGLVPEDIHRLLEMQLTLKMHSAALLVLHHHCGVQLLPLPEGHETITAELLEDSLDAFERCLVPAELCIDIKTKLVVCLIHLGARHLVMDLVREMKRELDPEKSGDFLLNVAEAFMEAEFENDALPLLRMLVRTCNYGTAAVWLLYAECLKRLGRHQEATKAYERTCELAPRHAPSRLSLGQLLDAQGLRDQAIDCLATDSRQLQDTKDSTPEQQQDSASLLLCQARLLWDSGQREAFIESAITLVRAHCLSVCSAEEYDAVYSNTYHLSRMKVLRELHEKRGFTPGWLTMESGISVDELQACFLELYRALQETGRMDDLRQVATEVLVAPMFNKDGTSNEELEFLSFLAHYQDPDHVEHSFAIIRATVLKYPNQVRAWNLLGLVANQIPAWRKKGFYLRLLYKHENSLPLGVLVAHNAFLCANYKHALAEYTQLLRHVGKEEPMLLLRSGISLMRSQTSAGVQKSPRKFYWLATQGTTFLCRYLLARGSDCQEALFNVGRALHELGYPHMAVNMYQRALAAPPAVRKMPEVFDLRREIAFNLSLLYQRGGNNKLADWCINHYCVI
ncbi:general transcription factor 3C polypeptide 3 [Rhipicephalus microplus]|uniref:general transcription factor 3C polypeptide 3 n=1 Tax=Rhipicephalus microplus TaxID=6941 RepID=UPI003F6B7220